MAFEDDAVKSITDQITHISLHLNSPGTTGTNEVSGGSYVRLAPTFTVPNNGAVNLSTTLNFSGPANSGPVTYVGYWKGTTFWKGRIIPDQLTFNSSGLLSLISAPISATSTN